MTRRYTVTHDRAVILAGTVLIGILVTGFLVLSVQEIDTAAYALFCAGPVTTTIIGAVVTRKVSDVAVAIQTVEKQTETLGAALGVPLEDVPPDKPGPEPPLKLA